LSSNTALGNTPVNQGYVQLIHTGETGGIDGTLRTLYDGDGTPSDLQIASNKVKVSTELYIGSDTLQTFVENTVDAMTIDTPTFSGTANGVNLILSGDLTVNGTTTTINQTNLDVSDNIIGLNRGASSNANDSGLIIERGSTGDNAAIIWDESADKFTMGTTTSTPSATGNLTITTGTLVANLEGNVTGNLTLDSVNVTAIQTSGESFADNDTSLMTSAAIDDQILSKGYGFGNGDITAVNAGVGLSGGGLSGDVTLTVDLTELTDMTEGIVSTDELAVVTGSNTKRKALGEIGLTAFSNDLFPTGSANQVMTNDADGTLSSEANLVFDGTNLGIGETSIDAKLHMTTASSGLVNVKMESAGSAGWRFGVPAGQTYFAFDDSSDDLSTPELVITNAGKLGVGESSVDANVHITGSPVVIKMERAGVRAMRFGTPDNSSNFVFADADDLKSNQRMVIDSSGNIGLGNTNPTQRIDMNSKLKLRNTSTPTAEANSAMFFAQSGEMRVIDASGNNTLLSPHNFSLIPGGASEDRAWSYYSENQQGQKVNIDMMRLARLVEQLTNEKLIYTEEDE
jgi:hypothetical protein